jgi:hypothetical protein
MQLKLLIDGIVQQTTVLIARLSASTGVLAPLHSIADQVFLDLSRELENQGVRKVLVADMFGLALRTYQRKTQRLTESASEQSRTLWETVFDFVRASEVTRARIAERFARDGEREVAAVLSDLVRSGLIYVTGAGNTAVYGANSERVRAFAQSTSDAEALIHYAWFKVFHGEITTRAELREQFRLNVSDADALVTRLLESGRVIDDGTTLKAVNVLIPLGSSDGIETALLDHFRAAAAVVAERVAHGPDATARTGGSTFSFNVDRDHPDFEEIVGLLHKTRSSTQALWERVMAFNQTKPPSSDALKITFYAGQSCVDPNLDLNLESTSQLSESKP